MTIMTVATVPRGAVIEWAGDKWTVNDVREHAMTDYDGTAWLILEGWKDSGGGDPPRPLLDTPIIVYTDLT